MIRIPIALVLLAAFLPSTVGCYRAGAELPAPRSATDTAAIAEIEAARSTYITARTGGTTQLKQVRVEYPAISGLAVGSRGRILISFDSIARIRAREKDRDASAAAGAGIGFLAGGVLAGWVGYQTTRDEWIPGGGIVLAVPGALLGMLFGAIIGHSK